MPSVARSGKDVYGYKNVAIYKDIHIYKENRQRLCEKDCGKARGRDRINPTFASISNCLTEFQRCR